MLWLVGLEASHHAWPGIAGKYFAILHSLCYMLLAVTERQSFTARHQQFQS